MIESLTKQQEEKLAFYRDKWLAIGLDTNPCDRSAAQDAARRAFDILPAPEGRGFRLGR